MRFRVGATLVAVLTLVATPTFAQSVTGAVKVGVNFAKVAIEEDGEDFDSGTKTGLAIGAAVDVPITPMFSFSPEFLYTMKGGKGGDFGSDDNKAKLGLVQIPLLFKASVASGAARPFVTFGPAVGFVTSAKFEEGDIEEDIKDDVKSVELSGVVGAGLQFGRGIIEFRYDHGFTNLEDEDDNASAKTRTFSILFGVSFGG